MWQRQAVSAPGGPSAAHGQARRPGLFQPGSRRFAVFRSGSPRLGPPGPGPRRCASALRRSRGHLDPGQVHHPIGESKQCRAVGNHYHRAPPGQSGDGVEHVGLGLAVKVGGGLVEEQEARVAEEGARQSHPLPFSGRDPRPTLPEKSADAREAVPRQGR